MEHKGIKLLGHCMDCLAKGGMEVSEFEDGSFEVIRGTGGGGRIRHGFFFLLPHFAQRVEGR